MNKTLLISCAVFFISSVALIAQENLNSYKYILIPKQYEFQKGSDQYQINSLTKFLFNRAGFTALFEDEPFPEDFASDRCLGLKAIVKDNSGMFKTKVSIDFFDCKNAIVYSTAETFSKLKDFKGSYHDAIRKNFVEIEGFNYKYTKAQTTTEPIVIKKVEEPEVVAKVVAKVVEEIAEPEESKEIETKKVEINEVVKKPILKEVSTTPIVKQATKVIEGNYEIGEWGRCTVVKKNDNYAVLGGDENFEFGLIYKTSKPTIYIVKWTAYKQPQLLELDTNGNLKVDSEKGEVIYKRVH